MWNHTRIPRAGALLLPALLLSVNLVGQLPVEPRRMSSGVVSAVSQAQAQGAPVTGAAPVRRAARHVFIDERVSSVQVTVDAQDLSARVPTPVGERARIASWSVALNIGYPMQGLLAYSGAMAGVTGVRQLTSAQPLLRTRVALPIGVRFALSPTAAARSEVRLRLEERQDGQQELRPELVIGGGWKF